MPTAVSGPSRVWFLGHGCRQVPLESTGGKVLWAHQDGYFLNAQGQRVKHDFSPSNQRGWTTAHPSSGGYSGSCYPKLRTYGNKTCHHLMALAYYGERPTFTDKNGKPYVGICHHLIPDKFNYKPANLLCWLTREQHKEADRRQDLLETVVPDGNLYLFSYERLRELQDPRTMNREHFEQELEAIRKRGYHIDPSDPMEREMSRHCEC